MSIKVSRGQHRRFAAFFFAGVSIMVCAYNFLDAGGTAQAVAAKAPGVLRVSPALSNVSVSRGETSTTVVVTVTNLTPTQLAVKVSARDFGAQPGRPGGMISLYDNNYNPATNPHSLQTAMSVSQPSLVLGGYASGKVPVVLSNLDRLAPGGHYGAILFSPQSTIPTDGHPKVSLQSAIASLIFLKTATGGTQSLQLLPVNLGTIRLTLPGTLYADFRNTGNTQSSPHGQLTLFGPAGRLVSTTVLNSGSGLILPGSSRLFTVGMSRPNALHALPGKYRLVLQYGAGNQTQLTEVSWSFYYINLAILLPALLLLIVLVWLLKISCKPAWLTSKKLARWLHNRFKKPKEEPALPKPKKRPPPLIQG